MDAPPPTPTPAPALRSNRTVIVALLVAALSVTAFSVVGIASLLGWLPQRAPALAVPGVATNRPAPEPAPSAPRETLAPIPEGGKRSEPLMPRYSPPHPPAPAPAAQPPATPPARPPVHSATLPPAKPMPEPAREAPSPRPPAYAAATRSGRSCTDCGRVTGVAVRDDQWEIRVRFEDGAARTFRYRSRPPFEAGDRVRLDGAFLTHD